MYLELSNSEFKQCFSATDIELKRIWYVNLHTLDCYTASPLFSFRYSGRGLFLDPPECFITKGNWHLSLPDCLKSVHVKLEATSKRIWFLDTLLLFRIIWSLLHSYHSPLTGFYSCTELLCPSRDSSSIAHIYSNYISEQVSSFAASNHSSQIGSLIIEPGKCTFYSNLLCFL